MYSFIKTYRQSGYNGYIQVIEIDVDGYRWFYNSNTSISQNLFPCDINKLHLIGVHHYINKDQNLEITRICFTKNKANTLGEYISSELKETDRTIPYYKKLRPFIGKETLFCIGMCVIIEKDNKIAIAKRTDTGEWSLPAGMKELSETISENVHEEVMEELGITIYEPELKAITSGLRNTVQYPNGDQIRFVNFLFSAKYKAGVLRANDNENIDVKWIEKDEVEEFLSGRFLKGYRIYQNYKDRVIVV